MDDAKMAARLAVQLIGGALMARGLGDAAIWEAVAGLVVALVGFFVSRRARRQALATVPPDAAAKLQALNVLEMARAMGRA
jgi:uncharacterized protein YneF (UPF0154 family)